MCPGEALPPSAHTLKLGVASSAAVSVLCVAYGAVLVVGLIRLPSPDQPIQDPWFTLMELLILAIAPFMVAVAVALQALVPPGRRPVALLSVVFMGICAAITSLVHFSILALSRQPAFVDQAWHPLVFAFKWPSVVYALDILAWDVFFALGAFCAAMAVPASGPWRAVRVLLFISAALASVGLLGVPLSSMPLRNVGIIGYAVFYPVATALLAMRFRRARQAAA